MDHSRFSVAPTGASTPATELSSPPPTCAVAGPKVIIRPAPRRSARIQIAKASAGPSTSRRSHDADKENRFDAQVTQRQAGDSTDDNDSSDEERVPGPSTSVGRSKRGRKAVEDDEGYTERVARTKRRKSPRGTPVDVGVEPEPERSRCPRIDTATLNKLLIVAPEADCPWPECKRPLQILQTVTDKEGNRVQQKDTSSVSRHFAEHVIGAGGSWTASEPTECPACSEETQCGALVRHVLAEHWEAKYACFTTLLGMECPWRGKRSDTVRGHMGRKHSGECHLVP